MYADFLDISQEVQQALREGKPVVALESVMVALRPGASASRSCGMRA